MSKIRNKKSISRREFVAGSAGLATASVVTGFPNIVRAADPIRTIGLGVSIINESRARLPKILAWRYVVRRLDTVRCSARR